MEENENTQFNLICMNCNENFVYKQEETWWDFSGYTDTKLTRCPYCGKITVVKYDEGNLDVNKDDRFYDYRR